jgi:glycosyltransferase involved in cell wall biosynthesis
MTTIDIAIPVLNEEHYLKGCLDSVLEFELPENVKTTVYILDGGSTDKTADIASNYANLYHNFISLKNPGKIQSCALNIVISQGSGDYILRLDAHSFYPSDYLKLCLETSQKTNADNVGGVVITNPGAGSYQADLVQALTTHRFGVGNSDFRLDARERAVDTVPYGFFKRSVFDRIGLFDERLVRAQDYEINRRIIASGGTVWLNPEIKVHYHNQPSLLNFYKKQVLKEAPYNAYLWVVAPYAFTPRHAITGFFSAGIIGGLTLGFLTPLIQIPFLFVIFFYFFLSALSSIQQAIRYAKPLHVLFLPFSFFFYHFLHGLGLIWGMLRVITRTAPVQKINEPWAGAGQFKAWPKSHTDASS